MPPSYTHAYSPWLRRSENEPQGQLAQRPSSLRSMAFRPLLGCRQVQTRQPAQFFDKTLLLLYLALEPGKPTLSRDLNASRCRGDQLVQVGL